MRISIPLLIGALLVTAAPAMAAKDREIDVRGEAKLSKALDGRVAGNPVSCINLRDIRSSTIVDGTAILYQVGSTIYVNRPEGASSLDSDDILVTKTHSSRLCDIDTVRTIDRGSRFPTGFVALNEFVPYKRVRNAH